MKHCCFTACLLILVFLIVGSEQDIQLLTERLPSEIEILNLLSWVSHKLTASYPDGNQM